MAAIIGKGKNKNQLLKNITERSNVKTHTKKAEYFDFAPDSILNAVRTKTAVTGSHQKSQENILDMARPKTSFSLEYLDLVIVSAILAEIIVSRIAMIATIREIEKTFLDISIKSPKLSISTAEKIFKKGEKVIHVYLSESNIIFQGIVQFFIK